MKTILALLATSLLFVTASARAGDLLLEIDGIPGTTVSGTHTTGIPITNCSFGLAQTGLAHAGGAGSPTKSDFSTVALTKQLDTTSPLLFISSALGKTFPHARIIFQRIAGGQSNVQDYFVIELTNAVISSYAGSADDETEDVLFEKVSLSFSAIKLTYYPQLPSGSLSNPIVQSFDVVKNKSGQP